jgi:DNA-binding transcriptional LysR family regulator
MLVALDEQMMGGLRVMIAAAESGSFARAGEALGMTQSGVSRAIARLERRIGVRLFHRTARAIALTDEGRRLHDDVAPLLEGVEAATLAVAGDASNVRGRLRVNVDAAIGNFVVAPRLAEFLVRYPDVSVELIVRDRLGDFVSEGFDIAVRFGELTDSSLVCRRLFETRVLTCAAPSYFARRGMPQHPSELVAHDCIGYRNPATGRPFAWELVRHGEKAPVAVQERLVVNDPQSGLAACLAGFGIGQPLECYMGDLLATGRLVQCLPEWSDERFPAYLYHRSGRAMPAKVRAFIDFARGLQSG